MITIYIDNKPYQVQEGQNLLEACLGLGFDLPYFCWHPAMHSVGACRQCAVKQFKDEKDTRGRIVMSCLTPLSEGMRISVDDPEAKAFRGSVIEFLMVNHPHDCPVCDEGGECHLQDMTVMTGHNYRHTRFPKRTHRNQDLGPFINHEMNRCIACYRCVRFYCDYAGGRDLNAFACHDHVYFGRHEDGVLESEFSGNLVEVCPTGVFTDKTLKEHYTRKWDLQTAPSVCVHCGLGCNTIPGERYGSLRRILNRYNGQVNGYFLCDRGRFGYGFVNSDKRIRQPFLGAGDKRQATEKATAVRRIAEIISAGKGVVGIGSPRASLESNFALRSLVGPENFYSGMSAPEHGLISLIAEILSSGPARTPSLREVESADCVLVLGEDLTNTAPLLDLALRQCVRGKGYRIAEELRIPAWDDYAVRRAAQDERSPLFLATVMKTKLDDIAARNYYAAPDDIARLGFAAAHELDSRAPAVPNLRESFLGRVQSIAQALKTAKQPLIISGTSLGSDAVVRAAAAVARALCEAGKPARLCYVVPECNSLGLGLLRAEGLDKAIDAVRGGRADTIVILENDLYQRADRRIVDGLLKQAKHVIVMDHVLHETASRADVLLPAATFAESDGTFVNNEGRAQRFYRVYNPSGDVLESWRWTDEIRETLGRTSAKTGQGSRWENLIGEIASAIPLFGPIRDIAPPVDFTIAGLKIPRQPHRYSGRTSILANISVHEPKPPDDPDSPLSFSMEGYEAEPPAPLISRYWAPGWNSVQALNKFQQEIGGPLRGGDPGKRLLEAPASGGVDYSTGVPEAFRPAPDKWLLVPVHHIFGSEELSLLSPAVAERTPKAGLMLNPEDAGRLMIAEGSQVEVELTEGAGAFRLPVIIAPDIPAGIAGLCPAPGDLTAGPKSVRIRKAS